MDIVTSLGALGFQIKQVPLPDWVAAVKDHPSPLPLQPLMHNFSSEASFQTDILLLLSPHSSPLSSPFLSPQFPTLLSLLVSPHLPISHISFCYLIVHIFFFSLMIVYMLVRLTAATATNAPPTWQLPSTRPTWVVYCKTMM